jgi:hypothetical protein
MVEQPAIVLCHFRVKPRDEDTLMHLLRDHDAVLRKLDLVTDEPGVVYRGSDPAGRPLLWNVFVWKSEDAARAAHAHPEVAECWERMEPLCEERGGAPSMEFPHVERSVL